MSMKELNGIRRKYDCLTYIQGDNVTKQKIDIENLFKSQREKKEYTSTGNIPSQLQHNTIEPVYNRHIQNAELGKGYICQCKCGHIFYLPNNPHSLSRRHRFCDTGSSEEYCGLRKKHNDKMKATYPREKHPSYDCDFTNKVHETLNILECIDENYEEPIVDDKRKKGAGVVILHKKYKCECWLCGKQYEFLSSDFIILSDTYGANADKGYYSKACCDCHKISSFQWRTIKLFQEYGVNYIAEYWDQGLYIPWNNGKLLRYDFAILDANGDIKCFIECQGEQHYKPVDEFGGEKGFRNRKRNDEKKREYAREKNIPLIEIPYTCNTYEKEKNFLEEQKVLYKK